MAGFVYTERFVRSHLLCALRRRLTVATYLTLIQGYFDHFSVSDFGSHAVEPRIAYCVLSICFVCRAFTRMSHKICPTVSPSVFAKLSAASHGAVSRSRD
uniref:Putative secreted peptide n=1 Tax=Anopheles braziliensis TaxID=58242 RepID=A0A2M3ZWI5_9DIPT